MGALATCEDGRVSLRVRVLSLDGRTCLETRADGTLGESVAVGERAAKDLLARGAGPLLA